MKDSKLIALLKTFSVQEMKDFEKFVSSPYFSKGRNFKQLYSALKKYYPAFKSPGFTQENIFRQLFPEKKFEKNKSMHLLNVMFSELTSLAEKFLAIEQLQNEKYRMNKALFQSLENRNKDKQKLKLILNSIEQVQKYETGKSFFQELINLYINLDDIYFFQNKYEKIYENVKKVQLYTYGYYIDLFGYIVNVYGALNSYNPKKWSLNTDFLNSGLQNFEPVIFEKEFYDDGLGTKIQILIDYFIIKAQLHKNDEESYFKAVKYFKNNCNKFSWAVNHKYCITLINICSYRAFNTNTGKKYFLSGSDLVDFAIKNRIYSFYKEGPLSHQYFVLYFGFKNTVLGLKDLKTFTDSVLELVDNKYKQELHDYAHAWISFKARDYEKTLELISKIGSLFNKLTNMMSKLKILSLYSLNYIEETIYCLNSYEYFVKGNLPFGDQLYNKDLKFIKAIRLLISYRTKPAGTTDLLKLSNTINEYKNFNINPWFEEELERLKAR